MQLGELKADVFRDLSTADGVLYIWEVPKSLPAERIALAWAASRDNLGPWTLLFSRTYHSNWTRQRSERPVTPDTEANSFRHDVHHLNTKKLFALAIRMSRGAYTRLPLRQVKTGIQDGIRDGHLRYEGLSQGLRFRLGAYSSDRTDRTLCYQTAERTVWPDSATVRRMPSSRSTVGCQPNSWAALAGFRLMREMSPGRCGA